MPFPINPTSSTNRAKIKMPSTAKMRPSAIFAGITFRDDHFAIWKASVVLEKMTTSAASGAMNA